MLAEPQPPRQPAPTTGAEADEDLERDLRHSFQRGWLTNEQYEAQLREARTPGSGHRLLKWPVRTRGDTQVRDGRGMWTHKRGPFATRDEAMAAKSTVHDGGNGGLWASNNAASGGCRGEFHCNAHLDGSRTCPVFLRLRQGEDGWHIDITDRIHHGLTRKMFQREVAHHTYLAPPVLARVPTTQSSGRHTATPRQPLAELRPGRSHGALHP